jgi:hypothetical protein
MKRNLVLTVLLAMSMFGAALYAQDQRRERGGEGRERGEQMRQRAEGQQPRDREAMAARMSERMREQLGVTSEEWEVLQPKVQRVTEAQMATRGGGGGWAGRGAGGPGGPAGQGAQGPQNAVARASADLRLTLQNENASADEISQKITALRAARRQAEAELTTARQELRELLTQRQEAQLVMMGLLD